MATAIRHRVRKLDLKRETLAHLMPERMVHVDGGMTSGMFFYAKYLAEQEKRKTVTVCLTTPPACPAESASAAPISLSNGGTI